MPTGLYSDPYLKSLIEQRPDLAEQFFHTIADSEYLQDKSVTLCLETPGWVLEKAIVKGEIEGTLALENPNFPEQKFAELIQNQKFLESNVREVMAYPKITQTQIHELIKNRNINIRGLALCHSMGDEKLLLDFLNEVISTKNENIDVLYDICTKVKLSERVFNFLFTYVNHEILYRGNIGGALLENPTLTEPQKTLLVLSEITLKNNEYYIFWQQYRLHFNCISSLPFYQIFNSLPKKIDSAAKHIGEFNLELIVFFSKEGHPLTCIMKGAKTNKININLEGLKNLNSYELLNRLFWTELCERDDFDINRINGYRLDNVCVSHPILGREFFNSADYEESGGWGGVFMFNYQDWLIGNEELSIDRAIDLLIPFEEESLTGAVQDEITNNLGGKLIALTISTPDLTQKYGFELNDEAEDWMLAVASEYAEPDDFDVSAELNPTFQEILTWRNLPEDKKITVFQFLSLGLLEPESKLRNDAIHFLGCMALHESTPQGLLDKLDKLNIPIITEIINHKQAKQLLADKNFIKAEELLIELFETATNAKDRDDAAITLIEKILIPNLQLCESEMWIRSVTNSSKRKDLRKIIKNIKIQNSLVRVNMQSDWKNENINLEMKKSSDQQYFYNRFVKFLSSQDQQSFDRDSFSTWPGASFYGFLKGIWDDNPIISELGCKRETIALAVFDYLNEVMENPLVTEEQNPRNLENIYEDYAEEEIIKLCQINDPSALKQYGVILDRKGDRSTAIEIWKKAESLGNLPAVRNLAICEFQNGNYIKAVELLKSAINKGSITCYFELATFYESENPELVEQTLLEGLKSNDSGAINNLGLRKQNQNQLDEAMALYRKAAELGDHIAMLNLSNLLFPSNRKQSLIWLERAEDGIIENNTHELFQILRFKHDS
jgi:hypothetical protein